MFSEVKHNYLYKKLFDYLNNNNQQENDIDSIFEELYNKDKNIEKIKALDFIEDNKYFKLDFYLNNNEDEMLFLSQYTMINKKIIEIIKKKDLEYENIDKYEYYIFDSQIILMYNKNIAIIGVINEDNLFIPEKIIESEKDIKIKKLIKFLNEIKIIQGEKIQKIYDCTIYLIDRNKYNYIDKINKVIKVLLNIYFYYEELINKINEPYNENKDFEKYYIINKKCMNKIKETLKYEKFYRKMKDKNIINLINKYKTENIIKSETINSIGFLIDFKSIFSKEFIELIYTIKNESLNELKNNKFNVNQKTIFLGIDLNNNEGVDNKKYIFYFENFEIISEQLKDLLLSYNLYNFRRRKTISSI